MLFGVGLPLLRSLLGAVRDLQLYILRTCCNTSAYFNSSFFSQCTRRIAKKKYTILPQKQVIEFFFKKMYTTYRKKEYTHLAGKKLHDLTIFLYTSYMFHVASTSESCALQ